jgi:hypothetical protein
MHLNLLDALYTPKLRAVSLPFLEFFYLGLILSLRTAGPLSTL